MTRKFNFYPQLLLFGILLTAFSNSTVSAQELLYREESGDNVYLYYYTFTNMSDGHKIRVARATKGDTIETHVLITDPGFKTLSWHYRRFGEHTDVTARLTPEGVHIKGYLDGDELDEFEELDDDEPWIQLFPMNPGMENFLSSDEDEIVFWSIGTESPADMEIHSFSAEKEETTSSDEFGCAVIRVNFSPTGWKSMFWDGDYYFRQKDGRIVGYRGDGAPGKPSVKTTLVKEE